MITINNTLNIGDTVWTFNNKIGHDTVQRLVIDVIPEDIQIEYYANYFHFRPETEGKTWWRTPQAVVEHIQKNILPEPPPVDPVVSLPSPLENLKEKFNSFFK